jgi:hypothetical protein
MGQTSSAILGFVVFVREIARFDPTVLGGDGTFAGESF